MQTTLLPIQRFWKLLQPDQREIRNVYVYAIFNGLINLSLPLGVQAIVNLIQGGAINTSWIVLVVIVVIGVGVSGALQIFQLRIVEDLQQKIFTRAAFEFAYRIPRIKLEKLYQQYAPELMNRFFDITSVQKGLSKILIDFSAAVLQITFGLILLSLYHPFFILFSLVLILFVFAAFRLTASKGLVKSLDESKYKYKVVYWLEELARTSNTFKLAGNSRLPMDRTNSAVSKYIDSRESHFKILLRQYSFMVIFKVFIVAGLLAIGGVLVMEQLMNLGQFVAAEIIILLIIASVEKLVLSIETIYDVLTGIEKIGRVTDLELEAEDGIDLSVECQQRPVSVEMLEVTFTYPGAIAPSLKDLNIKIESGTRAVITGANGSGKSTLLQIIAGLYDIETGTILYQGLPKSGLSTTSIRAIQGDSLSQEQLFEGSLRENLTLGDKSINTDRLKSVLTDLGIWEFVSQQPKGIDFHVEPKGSNLPKSMVQTMLLARSVMCSPKLLLIEDSFEVLDPRHRKQVIDYITDKQHPWTLICASTDPYLASKCDQVALLERGSIAQIGSYSQLKKIISEI
jgi:ABC-type bacteriocin/lantibiotic exporter with double-glycine peptidase domain